MMKVRRDGSAISMLWANLPKLPRQTSRPGSAAAELAAPQKTAAQAIAPVRSDAEFGVLKTDPHARLTPAPVSSSVPTVANPAPPACHPIIRYGCIDAGSRRGRHNG